jgi:hypothetical protein
MADRKAFLLRLDTELFQEIARRAKNDLRSINREMEFLLRKAVGRQGSARKVDAGKPSTPPPVLKGARRGDRRS